MYPEERQQAMADLVSREGRLSVADLAAAYDVTTETVRRDLTALERLGLVRRVHGGAVPGHSLIVMESAVADRDTARAEEKERIAQTAVALLPPPGSTILIDAGTTTTRFAAALPRDHQLTVITHAVPVAARLAGLAHIDLQLLPGRVRRTTQAAVGADTVQALSKIRAEVAFVGSNGLSVDHGLSTPDRTEAEAKAAMVAAGQRVVALTDSSKYDVETTHRFAALSEVDTLVCDAALSDNARHSLEATGLEVVLA